MSTTPADESPLIVSEGWEAYEKGFGIADNPHPQGTPEHRDWLTGWDEAHGSDPIF